MTGALDLATLTDEQFDAFYASTIGPMFASAETERLEGVKTFRTRMVIGGPAALALAAALHVVSADIRVPLIGGLVAAVLAFAIAYAPLATLSKRVKLGFLAAVARAIGVTYAEVADRPEAVDRCRKLDLLPAHDRAKFEDFFRGARHGCAFDLCEAHLEAERTDKDGATSWETVFRGKIVRVAFPKSFLGVTLVRRDAGLFNALRGLGDLKRVGLGDSRFEKLFEVYSNDQVEARYLVHPVFMERLMDLETSFDGRHIRCGFEKGDLIVVAETANQFEIGEMFRPLNDPARARLILHQLAGVMKLMDAVLTADQAPLVGRS